MNSATLVKVIIAIYYHNICATKKDEKVDTTLLLSRTVLRVKLFVW